MKNISCSKNDSPRLAKLKVNTRTQKFFSDGQQQMGIVNSFTTVFMNCKPLF